MAERVNQSMGGVNPDYSRSMDFAEAVKAEYCKKYRVSNIDQLSPTQKAQMMIDLGGPEHIVRPQ